MRFVETKYGFEYGAVCVTRQCRDEKKGWVLLGLETPKHTGPDEIQVYVTKTGKVRIFDSRGEWVASSKVGNVLDHWDQLPSDIATDPGCVGLRDAIESLRCAT